MNTMSAAIESGFLSVQEVADRLGLAWCTVSRMCRQGHLPAYKIGRQFRIAVNEFEAWFARQKITPEAAQGTVPAA